MRTKTKKIVAISLLLVIGIGLVITLWGYLPYPSPQPLEDLTQRYNVTRLTTAPADDRNPVWSPDGDKIIFSSNGYIYIFDLDRSSIRGLAEGKNFILSPDGKRLLFQRGEYIYVIDLDGGNLRKLSSGTKPAWRADGNEIIYLKEAEKERNYLFSMDKNLKEDLLHPVFTERLRNSFEANGFILPRGALGPRGPENIMVQGVGKDKWMITVYPIEKEGRVVSFIIEAEREELKVYEKEDTLTYYAYIVNIESGNHTRIAERTFTIKQTPGLKRGYRFYGGMETRIRFYSWNTDGTKIVYYVQEPTGYGWHMFDDGTYKRVWVTEVPNLSEIERRWPHEYFGVEYFRKWGIWDVTKNEVKEIPFGYLFLSVPLDEQVVWSPDGKKVALSVMEHGERAESHIWIIDSEKWEVRKLTSFVGANYWPEWSPDGKKLLYWQSRSDIWTRHRYYNFDICSVEIENGTVKQLTDSPMDEFGEWSPDGRRIAYISWHQDGGWGAFGERKSPEATSEIWMMNADGTDKKQLLSIPANYGLISDINWSPDGRKIAFVWYPNGHLYGDIYLIYVPVMER
jgi:Tol biopolymer transport system component